MKDAYVRTTKIIEQTNTNTKAIAGNTQVNKKGMLGFVFVGIIVLIIALGFSVYQGYRLYKSMNSDSCFNDLATTFCEQHEMEFVFPTRGYGFECTKFINRNQRENEQYYFTPNEINKCTK